MKSYENLKQIFTVLSHLSNTQRLMMWDEAVMMPQGGEKARAQEIATLAGLHQKLLCENKIRKLINNSKDLDLSEWDKENLKWMEKKYNRAKCLPIKLAQKLTIETIQCEQAWRKLRSQNNWKDFLPYFQNAFKVIKEAAKRYSDALKLEPYDAMLDEYAPGFNQKKIDNIFTELSNVLPTLIQDIQQNQKNQYISMPVGPFAIDKQKELGLHVMQALTFDFNCGRLDVSHHPFCSGSPTDVRMTTRYQENNFLTALMGICHETGHGLYEQGLPKEWLDQPVGHVNSMAMHESQSLLIEMQVCRSSAFFEFSLPYLKKFLGNQEAFTADNLCKIMSRVSASFIRVDADEVTYPLHIILRYQLEKLLFANEIKIKDLPEYWDNLMQRYLNISTKGNYKDGVMQDVHWPSGAFGYFPAYTLGRLIAAQLYSTFIKEIPNFAEDIQSGKFYPLIKWLREKIHSKASLYETEDLVMNVTGKPLSIHPFIDHVKQHYLT